MKTFILLFLLIGFTNVSFSQELEGQARIDSLFSELHQSTEDTNQVNLLVGISCTYIDLNPTLSLKYSERGLKTAKKLSWKKGIANCYTCMGQLSMKSLDYSTAMDYYNKSLLLNKEINNTLGIAHNLSNIALVHLDLGDFTEALGLLKQSLLLNEELGNKKKMAACLGNIGIAYIYMADYPKAIEYIQRALPLNKETGKKKGMANNLGNMATLYSMLSDHDKALDYYQQAFELNEELGDKAGMAANIGNMGNVYLGLLENRKALEHFQKALSIHKEIGNKQGVARNLGNIGLVYQRLMEYSKALEYHQRSFLIHSEIGNKNGMAFNLGNIGQSYVESGEMYNALEYNQKAWRLHEETGNKRGIYNSISNIGSIHMGLANYQKALKYHQQAYQLSKEIGFKSGVAASLGNIGLIYFHLSDYENAMKFFLKALPANKEIGNKVGFANNLANIGRLNIELENYSEALDYLYQSLAIREEIDDKAGINFVHVHLGQTFFLASQKSVEIQGFESDLSLLDRSMEYLEKAYLSNLESGGKNLQNLLYLSLVYEAKGKNQPALEYYKEYKTLQDSVFSVEKSTAIANLEAKRENEIKDKEIALLSKAKEIQHLELKNKQSLLQFSNLESEKQRQAIELLNKDNEIHLLSLGQKDQALVRHQLENKEQATQLEMATLEKEINEGELQRQKSQKMNMLGGFGMFLLAGSGIFYFINYRRRSKFREKVVLTEMKALRAQMNPHFIFNALGSIHSFVLQNNNENAAEYLLKFSTLMRLILNNSLKEHVSLEKEVEALQLYMELESIRMAHRFTYDIVLDPDIDEENTLIPPLLIQPFVENAIHHGIGHKDGPGYILVKLTKKGNLMHCIIEDNGVGRKKAMEMKGSFKSKEGSLGIKITNERLQIINQKSKGKGAINFTDLQQGLRVEINVPVEEVF